MLEGQVLVAALPNVGDRALQRLLELGAKHG
jgi:hypothetical protein